LVLFNIGAVQFLAVSFSLSVSDIYGFDH
jgi:hypothetical protein